MELTRTQKLLVVVGILGILGGITALSHHRSDVGEPVTIGLTDQSAAEPLAVHVTGAVARPGLYWLVPGTRVHDAVRAAGGFTAAADPDSVNLARVVQDGDKIEVRTRTPVNSAGVPAQVPAAPTAPAPPPVNVSSSSAAASASQASPTVPAPAQQTPYTNRPNAGRQPAATPTAGTTPAYPQRIVSLNRATKAELETLPGVGPELAMRILYYRYENGGFRHVDELLMVDGIGPSRLEKLRPLVML